jgi:drug/metabolite transporter (DMT)-like permease
MLVGFLAGERVDVQSYTSSSLAGWTWLILASAIGYASYTFLVTRAPLSLVSTFAFVNPAVAVFLGWLLLGEPLSRSVIIGLVVVLAGTALVVLGESRRSGPRSRGTTPLQG